jgi:hypothetical protein
MENPPVESSNHPQHVVEFAIANFGSGGVKW